MNRIIAGICLPLAVSGCALTAGLDAAGGSGGIAGIIDNKLMLADQVCTGLITAKAQSLHQLEAALAATAQMPVTVTVPQPVIVTPAPSTGMPPTVTPAPVQPSSGIPSTFPTSPSVTPSQSLRRRSHAMQSPSFDAAALAEMQKWWTHLPPIEITRDDGI